PVVSLAVVVPLAVNAATKARLGEDLLVDLPLLAKLDLRLEDVDLAAEVRGDEVAELFLPGRGVHGLLDREDEDVGNENSKRRPGGPQDCDAPHVTALGLRALLSGGHAETDHAHGHDARAAHRRAKDAGD